jgi:DNA-binding beta-propeller fold protein YncE
MGPNTCRTFGGLKPADYESRVSSNSSRRALARRVALLFAAIAAVTLSVPAVHGQAKPTAKPVVSAGNGTIYVGSYKQVIYVIDEATEKITREIPVSIGIPIGLTLSDDMSRLYVRETTYEKIEIIDRLKGTSLGSFTLSEGKAKTRIWAMRPDPQNKYLILTIKKYTLDGDRWVIGPPTLVQYDLAQRKITRTIPWPKGEEREGVGVLFSPDGKLLYMFGEDILIYETENFTEVDRWDVSRPLEPGGGSVPIGGLTPFSDEPGFYTGFFTMLDQAQGRRIMGVGRIELAKKKIDFHPIGPSRGLGFAVSPDRKRGYGMLQSIEEYELWTFDLENYRVIGRVPFRGRPRMGMRVSSNGNYIYVHTAGNTIDLHDAATFTRQRTITLDGDMTGFVLVPPPAK